MDEALISEFQEFQIVLDYGSPLLDRLRDLAAQHGLSAGEITEDWVAYSTQHMSCDLTEASCDKWAAQLSVRSKTAGTVAKRQAVTKRRPDVLTKDDIHELFDNDLLGQYGTQEDQEIAHKRGIKRSSEQTTPPSSTHKARATENGATPTAPQSRNRPHPSHTPACNPEHNGFVASTPAGSYSQRKNSRGVICSLNERAVPADWRGGKREVKVAHYDADKALTKPYHYMFQKVSDKALALLERTEDLGSAICHHYSLPDPLPVSQPSLEPATFVGCVVCEGEGHLNASSCLLAGPVRSRTLHSRCVRLEIPDSAHCSLFPGQVIAVEGVNNYSGSLISSVIYDQGVAPPLPVRAGKTIGGFSLLAAAGPFSTSDSLEMTPLDDVITRVKEEQPSILLLMGPFIDINHNQVKSGALPDPDNSSWLTLQEFFLHKILRPLVECTRSQHTQLLLMPSQRDAHHPFQVYPQPPFLDSCKNHLKEEDKSRVLFLPDPCTLSINGVCVGATSTDILFHLSARTMFRGPSGDRMSKLASHILKQQCYYPLVPPYRKEEPRQQAKPEPDAASESATTEVPRSPCEACEVNLDYIHAFEEQQASLPARPDVLILPSDLKPFVKALDGCVCINPGRLTRKATGGTFLNLLVPELPAKPDLSSDVAVSIVHI